MHIPLYITCPTHVSNKDFHLWETFLFCKHYGAWETWAVTTQKSGPPTMPRNTHPIRDTLSLYTRMVLPSGGPLLTSEVNDSLQKQSHVPPLSTELLSLPPAPTDSVTAA